MQRTPKIISALTIDTALGAGAALAANKVGGDTLPDEVKSARIKVPENTETHTIWTGRTSQA